MDDRLSESEACECESVDLTKGGGFQIGRDRPVGRSVGRSQTVSVPECSPNARLIV